MGDGMAKVRKTGKKTRTSHWNVLEGEGGAPPFSSRKTHVHVTTCPLLLWRDHRFKKEKKRCNETSGQLFANGAV